MITAYFVISEIPKATSIALVSFFYMLAIFGLMHGTNESIDWLRFISIIIGMPEFRFFTYTPQILMVLFFDFLLQFGINLLTFKSEKKASSGKFRSSYSQYSLRLSLQGVLMTSLRSVSSGDTVSGLRDRHSAPLPFSASAVKLPQQELGATLMLHATTLHEPCELPLHHQTGVWCFMRLNNIKPLGNQKLVRGLTMAAIGFACYAVFGGLIVKTLAGLPKQLYRAACAMTIAIASYSALDVFKID